MNFTDKGNAICDKIFVIINFVLPNNIVICNTFGFLNVSNTYQYDSNKNKCYFVVQLTFLSIYVARIT